MPQEAALFVPRSKGTRVARTGGKSRKVAQKGNAGGKGKQGRSSPRYPVGDRPACFAWIVEELAGFGSRDFSGWPTTTDRSCQEAVAKAQSLASLPYCSLGTA